MPWVRWRIYVYAVTLIQLWAISYGEHVQSVISMTEDGWRPIIGTGRQPSSFQEKTQEIQRKSPNIGGDGNIEIAKSNSIVLSTFPPSSLSNKFSGQNINTIRNEPVQHIKERKVPPHSKPSIQSYPSIALTPPYLKQKAPHRSPAGPGKKQPITIIKPATHFLGSKRKPLRGPSASYNDPFFHATASGVVPVVRPSGNVKTRDTPLGLLGGNHFSLNQPHGHAEFNRFIVPSNSDVFQQFKSQPLYVFSNPVPGEFKKQNDEFTRHLVPPPAKQNGQLVKFVDTIASIQQSASNLQNAASSHLGLRAPQLQDNLVIQPPEQAFSFQKPFKGQEPEVDIEITKQNFKDFHAKLPATQNRPAEDFADFDFHTISTPGQLPRLQTYEVTEGKWVDNSNGFTFNIQNQPQKDERNPPLQRPQIIQEPVVELNLPPFLPTPYKPDPAVPTSATQKEVSTVFSKVSAKLNKYREETIANSPLLYDIKEVSTHFPILGQPLFQSNLATSAGVENDNVSNDLSTTKPTTENSNTEKPKRRKPKPRRPVTTTTEESVTESSELQKLSESLEEQTERPRKRQRVRPNYRTSTENIDELSRYQTVPVTVSSTEEHITEKARGRNRYRQRGNFIQNDLTSRRRIRPTTTNHKMTDTSTGMIMDKDKYHDIEQTKYREGDTTTVRVINYIPDNERLPEESDIKAESSYVNRQVNNRRPQNSIEEIRKNNFDSEENVLTTENVTPGNILTTVSLSEVSLTTPTFLEDKDDLATTAPSSTTTTEFLKTTKVVRNRNKLKYNSSNRPRFSVKEYRQRLNQLTSTTASTTTDFLKTTEGLRLRFPSRMKIRTSTSTTTLSSLPEEEENTETVRKRFRPKDPRHGSITTTENSETEASSEYQDKYSNSRPKLVNRKTSDLKPKVQIRPNLFSLKRRASLGLRNKNRTEEITTTEVVETTQPPTETITEHEKSVEAAEPKTIFHSMEMSKVETTDNNEEVTTEALSDDDYSKRVSDLTSSFQNKYDTPGFFKTVPSNSRRIPNYFSISTEDPILPIEAFFPNLKDKE